MCFKGVSHGNSSSHKIFFLCEKNLLIWCLNLRKSFKKSMNFFFLFVVVIIFENLYGITGERYSSSYVTE